jgi:micrococcal nuclease
MLTTRSFHLNILLFSILFLSFFILPAQLHAEAGQLAEAVVTEVIDGDTIKVQLERGSSETVRYLLIDTPETHHPKRGIEELGREAYLANRTMVEGKKVFLELDTLKKDRYHRLLAYVWLDRHKNIMVNEEMIKRGFAMPLTIPPNVRYVKRIHKAFETARSGNRGLWGRAGERIFSASQVWSELPYLAGRFVTLKIKVRRVIDTATRKVLLAEKGRFSVTIYKNNLQYFAFPASLNGTELTLIGKVTAGYHGGEMLLKDPLQILSFGTKDPSTMP